MTGFWTVRGLGLAVGVWKRYWGVAQWQRALALLNAVALLFVVSAWVWGEVAKDRGAIAVIATHAPPMVFLLPPLLALLAGVAFRRWWATLPGIVAAIIALVPVGGLALKGAGPSGERTLSLLTYNVQQWTHSGAAVGDVVAGAAPDVFCLQEAGRYHWVDAIGLQLADFEARTADYETVRAGELVVGTRLSVIGRRVVPLPGGPKGRPLLEVVVRTAGGREVSVMTAHLVYTAYFSRSLEGLAMAGKVRRAQAGRIVEYVSRLERPVILCGDLNADFRSAALRDLKSVFRDAWQERGFGFGWTLPSGLLSRRIDYVLVRGLEVASVEVPDVAASDHRPVRAMLSLPE